MIHSFLALPWENMDPKSSPNALNAVSAIAGNPRPSTALPASFDTEDTLDDLLVAGDATDDDVVDDDDDDVDDDSGGFFPASKDIICVQTLGFDCVEKFQAQKPTPDTSGTLVACPQVLFGSNEI
jgi:hypothetical protein